MAHLLTLENDEEPLSWNQTERNESEAIGDISQKLKLFKTIHQPILNNAHTKIKKWHSEALKKAKDEDEDSLSFSQECNELYLGYFLKGIKRRQRAILSTKSKEYKEQSEYNASKICISLRDFNDVYQRAITDVDIKKQSGILLVQRLKNEDCEDTVNTIRKRIQLYSKTFHQNEHLLHAFSNLCYIGIRNEQEQILQILEVCKENFNKKIKTCKIFFGQKIAATNSVTEKNKLKKSALKQVKKAAIQEYQFVSQMLEDKREPLLKRLREYFQELVKQEQNNFDFQL